jgi:hypothetical protein
MKNIYLFLILIIMSCSNQTKRTEVTDLPVDKVIAALAENTDANPALIEKGVRQTAKLWRISDGSADDFESFCLNNFFYDAEEKERNFLKISEYLEKIGGNYNEMTLALQQNTNEATGALLPIDEAFAAYNPSTHLTEDLYSNKIAFIIALNFPEISLEEKEKLGENRLEWAYSRLGDRFTARIPAEVGQEVSKALSDADIYIANYNIYAGHLLDSSGKKIFPEDMILLAHWNLRDEIKADYAQGENGLNKQKTIYEAMKRIINQEIPKEVINSGKYDWNPYTNEAFDNGEKIALTPEKTTRYNVFLNNFKALKAVDKYSGNTYIDRNFLQDMEISLEETESLLREYLSAPEIKQLGKTVSERLGRELFPFDIWYDGFKTRSTINEELLSEKTKKLYPDAEALQNALPQILTNLGFSRQRADYLASKIEVDAARGSGHAWGAGMKGSKAHLRTRFPEGGLDYKGYNIAIHEFGHNVEQTISLYDVDYYMLNGVPNTAFTEALAFVFQKRDLEILGIKNNDAEKRMADVCDKAWSLFEISGVSLLDISVWKWIYANPEADAEQLKQAVIRLSKEIWNEYYSPIFGAKDETILAIYSHSISYPLYLSAYAIGHIIEFQLEQHLEGKNFASEVDRIYRLGRLTPNQWILQATGKPLSADILLKSIIKQTD